jgi:Glutaredoxin-related protein
MSVADFIRSEVNANEILLFMKGTPTAPACGFSAQVVRILDISAFRSDRTISTSPKNCAKVSRITRIGRRFRNCTSTANS